MTPSPDALPGWVAEAARLPLAFAQVREDALLDLRVVARLGPEARVLMVASGGCTAAALAATGQIALLHLCDINPAQLALARLKLRLLQTTAPSRRLALLGHAPMSPAERLNQVGQELAALDMTPTVFGPVDLWSQVGLDHAGRYEQVFAQMRLLLRPHQDNLLGVLRASDPSQQAAQVAPDMVLGQALDTALDQVMALPNLIAMFSAQATRNPVEPFARHFARQTRRILATLPAADNPYLWQMYGGCFPGGVTYPWFTAPAPRRLPELRCSCTDMLTALRQSSGRFDYVHLSNILDWLSVEEAGQLLTGAAAALRPGGVVLIRQLNSTLVIPPLGPDFEWLTGDAQPLHASDRSFFYRALHLGRRR
jgi:S-adenosylmethionine-diacylglycerol 3-amino-3-carboxypropyl transferase